MENELPSYKTRDPRGWGGDPKRGAAMGRGSRLDAPADVEVKLVLQKVRLDNGGYDANGTYFGWGGNPVYWYADSEGTIDACLRAPNRHDAKCQIRGKYPNARFYG